jgi:hypothetical protein
MFSPTLDVRITLLLHGNGESTRVLIIYEVQGRSLCVRGTP